MSKRGRDRDRNRRGTPAPSMGDHSLDLPYEQVPGGPINQQIADRVDDMASGVLVSACTVEVPLLGHMPALIVDFARPDGTQGPRVLVVLDEDQMAKLTPLVAASCTSAIAAARTANAP